MVAFRTEDLFFLEITTKLAENGGFPYRRPLFFGDRPQREAIAPANFCLSPKNWFWLRA